MKKITLFTLFLAMAGILRAQEVSYEEYDMANGLHVILHQDNSAPVIITSIMYHVGGKDRTEGLTGFAHLFEHLLFDGSKNIPTGGWDEIISTRGGQNNAITYQDRTYYYELFPSNNLELGLWLESERLLHPTISQEALDREIEVVKEERRLRYDNSPYGQILPVLGETLFEKHPYKDPNIGYMKDLEQATLEDVRLYNKKYYVPNNAVLVVAGDLEIPETKDLIAQYFGPIPRGEEIVRDFPEETPITQEIRTKAYDPNIQIPAALVAYRTPGFRDRDSRVLDMISTYLSDGRSSKLYKKLVDEQKQALQISAFNIGQEDYGMYVIFGLPVGETPLQTLVTEIEEEIAALRLGLISEKDYQKLLNKFENAFVNSNSTIAGIAGSLATNYMLYGDTSLINKEIEIYRSITREEIRDVAIKYLKPTQRAVIEYLPGDKMDN